MVKKGYLKAGLLIICASVFVGCAHMPGGIAPSSTPLEGRNYKVIGETSATDSRILLFGLLPISGSNSIRDAIRDAAEDVGGDALINVSVESSGQWWLLFTRDVIHVEGKAIKFTD